MTILYPARRNVKPFAAGLILNRPGRPRGERRMPYTAADLAWAAYELNKNTQDYEVIPPPIRGGSPEADEPDWDAMAAESHATDCLERGLIPSDVADYIAQTTLVGHPA
jgi:hypothetical protein